MVLYARVGEAIGHQPRRKAKDEAAFQRTLLSFLAAIAIIALERSGELRLPFSNAALSAMGMRPLKDVRDQLEKAGLIEVRLGFYDIDHPERSKLTAITPTPKLVQLVQESGLSLGDVVRPPAVTTVLTEPFTSAGEMPPKVREQDRLIKRYNEGIGGFTLHQPNGWTSSRIHLVRLFKHDWITGGRLYGGFWIDMPRVERATLLIDGEETCELDYKSLHPHILYAWSIRKLDFDPYVIPGFEHVSREVGKKVFNRLINGKTTALKFIKKDYQPYLQSGKELDAFVAAMMDRLSPITHRFASQAWGQLQKEDSELALKVIERCMKEGIPVYPIHDGFRVRLRDKDQVEGIMKEVYKAIYGTNPSVCMK
ncbi:hypothetical protein [Brevundimonas viscosa]|nr:hypothetical protein [Brevundimonas viscosa]